jgi:ligand-binding sensor domain-containing protein
MKRLLSIISITVLLCSQTHGADWRNWSNYSKVTGMVRQGATLWIAGHGGVMTIDTNTLQKTYYTKTAGQLPSLMVEDIEPDAMTGDIWIGTYDNGIVEIHSGLWTTYAYPTGVTLYHLAIDGSGTVWCATSGGLYKFTNHTFTKITNTLTLNLWDVKVFPNGKLLLASVRPVIYDPVMDSAVMVTTTVATYNTSYIKIENDSSFYFTTQGQGISHMVDTVEYYITDSLVLDSNNDQIVQMDLINNNLTVLTMNSKLYQYNGSAWSLHPHNSDAQATQATFLYQDSYSGIWLGGIYDGGIVRPLNGGADISMKKFALVSNLVTAIHDKSSTEIWVMAGNEIGVYNKMSSTFTQVYELPIAVYNNLFNVGDITIWNGTPVALTDSGLYQFTGSAWTILNIPGMVNTTYILSLASDSSGNLYAGTLNGIYVVNGTTVTGYTSANTTALSGNDVIRKAYFDSSRNTMWFSTTNGIVKLSNGAFTLINGTNYPQLTDYSYIASIAQDPSGNMWFGTAYGGLIEYDGTTYTIDSVGSSAGNQTVNAIAFDGSTMYAVDNVFGFWVRENGTWTNYSYTNSDLTATYLNGLYVDFYHNVWITAMNYGIQDAFGIDVYNKTHVALSVQEVTDGSVSIYPNPATDQLFVKSANTHDGDEVVLTDMLGRKAGSYVIVNGEINLSGLTDGIYLLQIAGENSSSVRIVKE